MNIQKFYLGHEITDAIQKDISGTTLDGDHTLILAEMFESVDPFREAFEANGWQLQSMRISLPFFFVLCDLIFLYDEQINKLHRVTDQLIHMSKHSTAAQITTENWSLRWLMLSNQYDANKEEVLRISNAIVDLIGDIINGQPIADEDENLAS